MAADVVQEIKTRIDLVELISQYVPLRRAGRAHKGLCPFHSEKTPSFTVDGERGFFKCYGCGKGGDCFTFLMEKEGLSFNEAGELLARRLGLEWQRRGDTDEKRSQRERLYDVNALAERFFSRTLQQAPEVLGYLEHRGLAPETVRDFRLGYAPGGFEALLRWLRGQNIPLEEAEAADLVLKGEKGLRDRFVDRLIFPIFDVEGRTIAFGGRTLRADGVPKYLNSRETPIFQKGRTLYGLHAAKKAIPAAGYAVAVEGYMDVIALHQAGVTNAVAGMGTAITKEQVALLRRYSERLELVLCYDGDSAGMRAALGNSGLFEEAGCEVRIARLPGGDDPDTYVKANGPDAFRAVLNRAEPLLDYQLSELKGKYDLGDADARLRFIRDATRMVLQSGSRMVRQEQAAKLTRFIDGLTEELYPGDLERIRQTRLALYQEVNSRVSPEGGRGQPVRGAGAGPSSGRWERQPPRGQVGPAASARNGAGRLGAGLPGANARALAERYVLRAALTEPNWCEHVCTRVSASDFADEGLSGIAAALLGNNGQSASMGAWDRAESLRDDPELAAVLGGLLVEEAPVSEEGLEECLLLLERGAKEARMRELQRAAEAGPLAPDERDEWRRLQSELGGRQRRED